MKTYERDQQKRPTKETYERDQEKRPTYVNIYIYMYISHAGE